MKANKLVVLGSAVALGAAGAGIAVADGVTLPFSAGGNTINGCYSSGGALKLLTPAQPSCADGLTPIQWNAAGPQGPQGPQGQPGPQGPTGTAGEVYTTDGGRSVPSGNTDTIVYLTLPPGSYELSAAISGAPRDASNGAGSVCFFSKSGSASFSPVAEPSPVNGASSASYPTPGSGLSQPIPNFNSMSLVGAVAVADGDVGVDCTSIVHDVTFNATLTAAAVGAIHEQDH